MSRKYSITENGAETNAFRRFLQKDFSQFIVFLIPMV